MTPLEQTREKILQIQAFLEMNNPGIRTFMAEIHKQLNANGDVVQALTEDEIAIIVSGYEKVSNITIAETAVKQAKSGGAKLKKLTADDL